MRYQLNFMSTAADRQKRRKIRRYTSVLYLLIWGFSAFVLFQVYSTQLFMANVYKSRTTKMERKISNIEPRILFLERKITERNRLRQQASLYVQENNRPAVWMARLADLAQLLPADLILTKIAYNFKKKSASKKPEILVDGYMIIEGEEQDIFAVDNLRAALAESLPNNFTYSKLLVENNHVYKEKDKLKLVFTLGYYK